MSELTDMREKRVAEQGEIIAKLRAAIEWSIGELVCQRPIAAKERLRSALAPVDGDVDGEEDGHV